jgi:hypothetical protein
MAYMSSDDRRGKNGMTEVGRNLNTDDTRPNMFSLSYLWGSSFLQRLSALASNVYENNIIKSKAMFPVPVTRVSLLGALLDQPRSVLAFRFMRRTHSIMA